MKFSDGYWLEKLGCTVDYATQIYDIEIDRRGITIYTVSKWIANRAMTLSGPLLTIRLTSTLENSIKVTIEHFSGAVRKTPMFQLYEDENFTPEIIANEDGSTELISGRTRVKIPPRGCAWSAAYYYDDRLLTRAEWPTTSLIVTDDSFRSKTPERFFARHDNGGNTYIREMLSISAGEYIYGFGEKFTPFVKNGQTIDIWNNDGGTSTEQSYKSVPFFVSSRTYGVFAAHPEFVSFEVGSQFVSKTSFSIQGEQLTYYIFGGSSIADVISSYTDLTGKPALPPAYSFGLWLSTSFTTDYTEDTALSFIDEMQKRDIPLDVFHFDCFWMKEFEWCGFKWDTTNFPDPEGMIERLKKRGLKVCVWVNPYIGQRSSVFSELAEKGLFIKNKDGSVFQTDQWQPGLAIIDFTNPEAQKWYADRIKELALLGVDAIKTDFGERIPTDVIYFDNSDPFKMHNYYSYLYNKTVFDALNEIQGENNVCLFARSATAGCQQFPVHWGGDSFSNYASMLETLRGCLSISMSGFGFCSHDISGFESTGTPDLYKRWTAFGLMSTHSRYHGSNSYRVPWNFDEESCDVARHFTKLKCRLMPYLFSNAVITHKTGIPMMRAMAVDFGFDRSALTCDMQYMLGENLLVAPIFNEEGTAEFYLPTGGIWTDIQSGEQLNGGSWYTRNYDYFGLPLYAKPNSIIVYGNCSDITEYDYTDHMHIVIYGLENAHTAETTIYNSGGTVGAVITATRHGNSVSVTVSDTDKPYTIESSQGLIINT